MTPAALTTSQRIGRRVREERRRQRLDQQTLALIANVAVRSVHRVESGEPTVRLDTVTRILGALGLDLDVRRRTDTWRVSESPDSGSTTQ